jgi:hypothetical protein
MGRFRSPQHKLRRGRRVAKFPYATATAAGILLLFFRLAPDGLALFLNRRGAGLHRQSSIAGASVWRFHAGSAGGICLRAGTAAFCWLA